MKKTNHTFALCAYQDSPYLEACLKSLKAQTVDTNILMVTSTPSRFITSLGAKYQVPVYVREGKSDIHIARRDPLVGGHRDRTDFPRRDGRFSRSPPAGCLRKRTEGGLLCRARRPVRPGRRVRPDP